ncbi:MAG: formylglycine-generating enzyme family protein, partial [Lentimicrobiaceae bacterium]|nr:formylglycine-generating enzyme family protein [Lentimicrobiaceae bacterium]
MPNEPKNRAATEQEKYFSLSPTDEAQGIEAYTKALNWALNPENKQSNIALAGAYGSGKSSILRTYEKEKNLKFLYISLACFNEKKQEHNEKTDKKEDDGKGRHEIQDKHVPKKENEQENPDKKNASNSKKPVDEHTTKAQKDERAEELRLIELSILQQLFYRKSNEDLPHSRFRKIDNLSKRKWYSVVVPILSTLLLIGSLFYLLHPTGIAKVLDDFKEHWVIHTVGLAVVLLTIIVFSIHIHRLIKTGKIRHFKFSPAVKKGGIEAQLEIDPKNTHESILNKHLDEILYFFEATDYNVVVIEDLDRFERTDIFAKLRELNFLINEYEPIKNKGGVVFIYAICDHFFCDKEERTKFFDFIIPVMPVVSASNSDEKLQEALLDIEPTKPQEVKKKTELSAEEKQQLQKAINDLSPYIDDMRTLHNIVNEYNIYYELHIQKDPVNKKGLQPEKLFAMILYKNLYPDDYEKLQHNEGVLYNAIIKFRENKENKENEADTDILFDTPTVREEQKNLVLALLRNGYIDENYSDYVYGGELSKNDKLFLSSIANKKSPDKGFDHPLNNKKALMEKIQVEDFTQPYILNYDLVDYLLASARTDEHSWKVQRENIFSLMADKSENSIKFVNQFIARGESDIAQFLKEITLSWKDIAFDDAIWEDNRKDLQKKGLVSKESIEAYRNKDKKEGTEDVELTVKQGATSKKKGIQPKNAKPKESPKWDIMFDDTDLEDLEMVRVEGGTFWMGGSEEQGAESSDDEKPVHQVTLDSFSIGKYPVTQAQWTQIMGTNPSYFAQGRNYPVEMVSWHDAQEFCKLLNVITGKNYRLPTEAEWEYAARGGNNASSQT